MVAAHRPMHTPRTRVGKISEQMMFGIGPNPVTNEHEKIATPDNEPIDWINDPSGRRRNATESRARERVITGMVLRRRVLKRARGGGGVRSVIHPRGWMEDGALKRKEKTVYEDQNIPKSN